jgi:hypothetical protein
MHSWPAARELQEAVGDDLGKLGSEILVMITSAGIFTNGNQVTINKTAIHFFRVNDGAE